MKGQLAAIAAIAIMGTVEAHVLRHKTTFLHNKAKVGNAGISCDAPPCNEVVETDAARSDIAIQKGHLLADVHASSAKNDDTIKAAKNAKAMLEAQAKKYHDEGFAGATDCEDAAADADQIAIDAQAEKDLLTELSTKLNDAGPDDEVSHEDELAISTHEGEAARLAEALKATEAISKDQEDAYFAEKDAAKAEAGDGDGDGAEEPSGDGDGEGPAPAEPLEGDGDGEAPAPAEPLEGDGDGEAAYEGGYRLIAGCDTKNNEAVSGDNQCAGVYCQEPNAKSPSTWQECADLCATDESCTKFSYRNTRTTWCRVCTADSKMGGPDARYEWGVYEKEA